MTTAVTTSSGTHSKAHFDRQYQTNLQHLKHRGLQPKTIDAYSRAIRRRKGNGGPSGYLFNHTALAKVLRAKMLAGIDAAGLALPGRTPKPRPNTGWSIASRSVAAHRRWSIWDAICIAG